MSATSPDQTSMKKSPDAFRTISEVADALNVPAHVLRFWESKFTQIRPVKRGGGRRYYRPDDVNLLKGIRELLYTDGMTIKGVQKVLRDQGSKSVASNASEILASVAAEVQPSEPVQPNLFVPEAEPLKLDRRVAPVPVHHGLSQSQRIELASIMRDLVALRDSMRN